MKRGFAKIEFFANLEYLKQEYNKGYVVSKILYEKAKQDKNISSETSAILALKQFK